MGKTREVKHEIDMVMGALEELHPYMNMTELDALIANGIHWRNKCILYGDNVAKRKEIQTPIDMDTVARRNVIFEPKVSESEY